MKTIILTTTIMVGALLSHQTHAQQMVSTFVNDQGILIQCLNSESEGTGIDSESEGTGSALDSESEGTGIDSESEGTGLNSVNCYPVD